MNVAFPALVLAVVLMPGFVFTHTYRLDKSDRAVFTTYSKLTVFAVVASAFLHAFVVGLVTLMGFSIDYHAFFSFVAGKTVSKEAVEAFTNHLWHCFGYFTAVYSLAYLLGIAARTLVIRYNLDMLLPGLSLHSENFALFKCRSPEALEVYRDPNLDNQLYVILDALMMVGDDAWIYTGVVSKMVEKPNGEIDTLTLTYAQKRRFDADPESDWINIDSYYFHLKYNQLLNYNVRYKVRNKKTGKVSTLISHIMENN